MKITRKLLPVSTISVIIFLLYAGSHLSAQENSVTIKYGEDEHIVIDKSNLKPADRKLFLAAIDHDYEGIEKAVKEGGNVNVQDNTGETPLFHCAASCKTDMIRLLIKKGANVNYRRNNNCAPLSIAITHKRLDNAEVLVKSGADVNFQAPIFWAIYNNYRDLTLLLIEKKAKVNVTDDAGQTPLICAASNGDIDLMRLLIRKRAKINAQDLAGFTALHWCVIRKNHDGVKLLLSKKASTTLKTIEDKIPVDYARESGDAEMVRLLQK